MSTRSRISVIASLLFLLGSCGGGGSGSSGAGSSGGPSGTITLEITDAPFELDVVAEAEISVDQITIYRRILDGDDDCRDDGDDDDAGGLDGDGDDSDDDDDDDDRDGPCEVPIVLYSGEPIVMDLLDLRNGITQELAQHELPAGEYRKLRLHLCSARLVLINGNTYATQDDTLRLSGHGHHGFKVKIDLPFEIQEGGEIHALLDFDLAHSFVPHPHSDHLNAEYYRLKGKIRAVNLSTTGGIHGSVLQADGAGGHVPVVGATVYVLPPGETDPDSAITSTATIDTGGFTFLGLEPGTYDLLAVKNGDQGSATGVTVQVGVSSLVDVILSGTGGGNRTAGVHGLVLRDDGAGGVVPVEGATVYVLPPGQLDPGQAVGSSTTGTDGAYSIGGLEPGTYDLFAVQGALVDLVVGVELPAASSVEVDITIQ